MNHHNPHFDESDFWNNHRALLAEYTAAGKGDDDRIRLIKEAVARLDVPDRTLLVAYAESGSLRKLGKLYGFKSATAVNKRLKIIRKQITDYVENHR